MSEMEWRNCSHCSAEERICNDVLAELFQEERLIFDSQRYCGKALCLIEREVVVDWMVGISKKLPICKKSTRTYTLTPTALHLAVFIFDYFLETHPMVNSYMQLQDVYSLAAVCLVLGAKVEERDLSIPRLHVINGFLIEHGHISPLAPPEFLALEAEILRHFDYNIVFPTAYHFLSHFLTHPPDYPDSSPTKQGGLDYSPPSVAKKTPSPNGAAPPVPMSHFLTPTPTPSPQDMVPTIDDTSKYFLELTLKDPFFLNFKRSLVAAVCVAAARAEIGDQPAWNAELAAKTGYTESSLREPMTMLKEVVDAVKKREMNLSPFCSPRYSVRSPWSVKGGESSFTDMSPIEHSYQENYEWAVLQRNNLPYQYCLPKDAKDFAFDPRHCFPQGIVHPSEFYARSSHYAFKTFVASRFKQNAAQSQQDMDPRYLYMDFPPPNAFLPPGYDHRRISQFPGSPGRLAAGGGSVRKRKAPIMGEPPSLAMASKNQSLASVSTEDSSEKDEEKASPGHYPCKRSASHPAFFCSSEPRSKKFKKEDVALTLEGGNNNQS